MTVAMRSRVHCDDLSGGRGKGLTPAVHRLRALDLICRLDAAATASHRQPSKRDLIEACAHRPIAVLSAHPAGACHPPPQARREMAITTIAHAQPTRVTVGVDTHGDVHVAHAKDQLGRCLDTVSIPTTPTGYRDLLAWARELGQFAAAA